jgi:putative GTP pyrophosphokinase
VAQGAARARGRSSAPTLLGSRPREAIRAVPTGLAPIVFVVAQLAERPSKKQLKKAGRICREFYADLWANGRDGIWQRHDLDTVADAYFLVDWFRGQHARPLARVNANLRYYVKKVGVHHPEVTQRLKRFSTIVDKLQREPSMPLAAMEDIAGVRVIVPRQDQVMAIRADLERQARWTIRRVRDYVADPKEDGYRAVHVIVAKDGCYVEIQLRTPWQDAWAQSVEQDTRRLRSGLKFGDGPDDLRKYYRMVSDLMAMRERQEEAPKEFMEELANLFAATRRYFPASPGGG